MTGAPTGAGTQPADRDRTFAELGLDSVLAVQLRGRLAAAIGQDIAIATLFDHPTPHALTDALYDRCARAPSTPHRTPSPPGTRGNRAPGPRRTNPRRGRRHGRAAARRRTHPEQFWELLSDGRDAVAGLPTNRGWDLEALARRTPTRPGTVRQRSGGFLHDATDFDGVLRHLAPRGPRHGPAAAAPPEVSWEAVERAGLSPRRCAAAAPECSPASSPRSTGPAWPTAARTSAATS